MSEDNNSKPEKGYRHILEVLKKWGVNETVAKIVAGMVIGALVAVGMLSCNNITPHQIYSAHDIYHKVTDKPCIFSVEDITK